VSELAAGSRRQQRRAQELAGRRADLLDAALEVFAEKGFDGAQISEIASLAEVSLASLYAMFKGKEELYQRVTWRAAEAIRDSVDSKVGGISNPRERLLALIDSLFAAFDEQRAAMRIYTWGTQSIPWHMHHSSEDEDPIKEIYQGFIDGLETIASELKSDGALCEIDETVFALAFAGAINTTALQLIATDPHANVRDAAASIRAMFSHLVE
jgi:AcrR family transcriptional regulator